jgi:hypothetical protein
LFSFFFIILFVFTLIFFSSCLRFSKGSIGAARANAISKYRRGSKATDPIVVAESPPGVGAEGVVLGEPLLQVITKVLESHKISQNIVSFQLLLHL